MKIILRKAVEKDYLILCEMAKSDRFVKDFPAISYKWGWKGKVVVATMDNEIVGFYYANICKRLPRATLYEIYVSPDARGQGIGSLLFDNLVNEARRAGKAELHWLLNKKNNAYYFYKKKGFLPHDSDDRHYKYKIQIGQTKRTLESYFRKTI